MLWLLFIPQIALLLYVVVTDVAVRIIPNRGCLLLASLGIITRLTVEPTSHLMQSIPVTCTFILILLTIWLLRWMGGGDVKLLAALSLGLPFAGLMQLLFVTVWAGGVLALAHLIMRRFPYPSLPPLGSSCLRRVYAIERWRHIRRAPLPYGVAIACGGIWTIIQGVSR